MTAPADRLTILVPELKGCALSTKLYVIADALTSDAAMSDADRADLVTSLEILAADARRLEGKVAVIEQAGAEVRAIVGGAL